MAKIISVVNQKGGVGKTTTSINLATYLAQLGNFVLLVDLDPQANATSGIGVDHKNISAGLYEVLMGPHSLHQVVIPVNPEKLRIVPANQNLAGANIELVSQNEREHRLLRELTEIQHEYDYIIIDSPPSLGLLTINGLVASDEVLIPVQCEYFALEGLGQLLNTINLVKQYLKPELKIGGALLTMYDERNKLARDVFNEIYKYFPNKIYRTVIPRSSKLAEAPSFGKSILHYDPNGRGAKAYHRLARELIHNK
jgi:chromosome partitioning protein